MASSASSPPTPYVFSAEQHGHLIPYIAALHAACITTDHVGPFLPPLTNEKLLPWWKERIAEAHAGRRVIVLLLPETAAGARALGVDLRGLAMLRLDDDETGAFRARVDCVLVGRAYRRQGGARVLMTMLESEAATRGRTLLLVNAETESVAEEAFKRFGYTEIGKVPGFSRAQPDGKKGETFFYKDLSLSS